MSTSRNPHKPSPQRLRALERRQRLKARQVPTWYAPAVYQFGTVSMIACQKCGMLYNAAHYHYCTWTLTPGITMTWNGTSNLQA